VSFDLIAAILADRAPRLKWSAIRTTLHDANGDEKENFSPRHSSQKHMTFVLPASLISLAPIPRGSYAGHGNALSALRGDRAFHFQGVQPECCALIYGPFITSA
jgi:hypothetical protein